MAAVLVLTLVPWFLHHQLIIQHEVVSAEVAFIGPAVVALSAMGALFLGGWARLLVALLPVAAFLVSWYITIQLPLSCGVWLRLLRRATSWTLGVKYSWSERTVIFPLSSLAAPFKPRSR